MEGIKAAVCQLKVVEDKSANIKKASEMIAGAAGNGARLVVLPEMFNCPYQAPLFPLYAETFPEGETFKMLSAAARESKVYLAGGSLPERDGERVYNTSFIFGPDGNLLGRHRKVHLFDVELPGGITVKESSTLGAGERITVVPTEFGPLGVAICYDIRFPELIRLMALKGAKIIVVPAAFNMTTGPAHWDLVFRMRAVDNQLFVIAASPARDVNAGYVAFGHSIMVDPWGEVLARAGHGEEVLTGELELARIEKIRRELPLTAHRRTDLYQLRELADVPGDQV
ncbi:aliphatic amidase AmiE [Desulfocucumis palustris]|uniref:Aliphatic amidase AmiE n=1 Tax=Desulfocucumis palustris TaxID=1898651 RepID=A0A2L2X8Y3_9FIRM|nr:carbon-nitrogen hydrolase family protein [Desulfocucumis palustris]GBF32578.1 aliphatic amidase AmiE [Desulfocucumis palustris]